ncbi:MAG: monooxygenase, partial [Rhodospirillales bacterium]|nr:monooxygenase [Rhodospirillales bacterium]
LRTAHFSIGSGTRLAMEDAIALNKAFGEAGDDINVAFHRFEEIRRPPAEAIRTAANVSARWYEGMADLMHLAPYDFAHSYMTRTGRVSDQDLEKIAPGFMAAWRKNTGR